MDKADGRARWMRSRGVEIYTPPTINILTEFENSREYDESVANAALALPERTFSALLHTIMRSAQEGLLRFIDRKGINDVLQSVNEVDREIKNHTAANNGWVYDYAAERRDTTPAAIHYLDSLMFGMRMSMGLAADAYLEKYRLKNYDGIPVQTIFVQNLGAILKNDSFRACVDEFARTGFGVIGDSSATTSIDSFNDAGATERLLNFDLLREYNSLIFYNASDDTFALNPVVAAKLRQAYQEQNRGEYADFDHTQLIGRHDFNEPYITAGCPERYSLNGYDTTGIDATLDFHAGFLEAIAHFFRLNQPALPSLVNLAQAALADNVHEEKLLYTKAYFDMLDAQDEQDI